MPLIKTNISIPFQSGVDTKSDPKQVIPGKLLQLFNGTFQSAKRILKRFGYTGLTTDVDQSTAITSGTGLATFLNELNLFSGTELYSLSESTNKWTGKGSLVSLELSVDSVVRNSYEQTTRDSAVHASGFQVFTWEDTQGGARYSVIDSSTGELIVNDALLNANGTVPKPIAVGNYVVLFYINSSNNHLQYRALSVGSPSTLTAAVDVAVNMNSSHPNYDATYFGNQNKIYIAYNNSDGGNGISLKTIDSLLTISSALDVTGESASVSVTIFCDPITTDIWVGYYNGTAVKAFARDKNLSGTAVVTPKVIETIASAKNITGNATSGFARFFYEITGNQLYDYFIKTNSCTNTGTVGTARVFIRSCALAGKVFSYQGLNLPVSYGGTLQPTCFLLNSQAQVIAKYAPSNSGLVTKAILPEINMVSTGMYLTTCLIKDQLTTITGTVFSQLGVESVTFDFLGSDTNYHATLASNLHITGGLLQMYDGGTVVEHGFHLFPEPVGVTTSTSGGQITAGTYQYSVCYEWTDNQGQIHRSAPSIPVSIVTTGSTSTNTVAIPTLRITSKTGVRLVVYRTANLGTIFYQITSIQTPTLNDPTVDEINYDDKAADISIVGNALLYTTGGVVDNIASPAPLLITQYKNRIMVVPAEDPLTIWYSEEVVPGTPVQFNDTFVISVDARGGPITAITQMDDKFIIFKENSIYAMTGEGPDSTGAQNDFSQALLVTTDGGTTSARSVVLMPSGLLFDSLKGKYIIDRALNVSYIGSDVEAFNGVAVKSATLISNTNQVRFIIANQTALVFDYFYRQWSIFTNHNGVDAVIFKENYTYLQPTGVVLEENDSVFSDNGQFYPLKVVTTWFALAGLQAFQRVYCGMILGEYYSPHTLLVKTAYDFGVAYTQEDYIPAGTLLGTSAYGDDSTYGETTPYGGAPQLYEWRINFQTQKCTAIQLSIEDVQLTDFGQGYSLSALGLNIGVKQGLNKLPPTTNAFG